MSQVLSYLIIPLVLLMVILNVYFRLKIIKLYKSLAKKNIYLDPKILLKKQALEEYVDTTYPQHADEINTFSRHLRTLMYVGIGGFLIILTIFIIVKF